MGELVFALSVIVPYAASTFCEGSSGSGSARAFCQQVDHCVIYLLIAGTVTTFVLSATPDLWRVLALVFM